MTGTSNTAAENELEMSESWAPGTALLVKWLLYQARM